VKLVHKMRVKNAAGLHTRPATYIVKLLQDCKSDVHFMYKREIVNAKSILNLLMLGAKKDAQITVTIEGEDATDVMKKISLAFDAGFEE
jgi:phosphocarrier protein HPr